MKSQRIAAAGPRASKPQQPLCQARRPDATPNAMNSTHHDQSSARLQSVPVTLEALRHVTCLRITSANSFGPSWLLPSQRAPFSVMLAKSEPVMWMRGWKSYGARRHASFRATLVSRRGKRCEGLNSPDASSNVRLRATFSCRVPPNHATIQSIQENVSKHRAVLASVSICRKSAE